MHRLLHLNLFRNLGLLALLFVTITFAAHANVRRTYRPMQKSVPTAPSSASLILLGTGLIGAGGTLARRSAAQQA